jgi:hypothetical protein
VTLHCGLSAFPRHTWHLLLTHQCVATHSSRDVRSGHYWGWSGRRGEKNRCTIRIRSVPRGLRRRSAAVRLLKLGVRIPLVFCVLTFHECRSVTIVQRQFRTYRAPVRYVTKTWSVVLLNKKYIYCYLKCIFYDKLLKPRQSFWITLYFVSENSNASIIELEYVLSKVLQPPSRMHFIKNQWDHNPIYHSCLIFYYHS